jgi:hypothetical protein
MDPHPEAPSPDLALLFTADVYEQLAHTLCAALPVPVPDTPETRTRRDHDAIARVACLLPANADEAHLAALYVAAQATAMDCLHRAQQAAADAAQARQYSARSISMMRESRQARAVLERAQAARQKREKDDDATGRAAWSEHCTLGLMADAIAGRRPAPPAGPPPATTTAAGEPEADPLAEADRYAIIYPRRAALIRRLGGLPANPDFGPPSAELAHLVATGDTPVLRSLDTAAAPSG